MIRVKPGSLNPSDLAPDKIRRGVIKTAPNNPFHLLPWGTWRHPAGRRLPLTAQRECAAAAVAAAGPTGRRASCRWGPAQDQTEAGGGAGGAGPLRSVRGEWGRTRTGEGARAQRLAGSERREERGDSPPGCGSTRPGPLASVGGREWARWALPSSCSLRPGRADARIASRARGLQAAPAQPCDAARSGAPRAAGGSLKDARHRPHIPPDWCKVAGGRIPVLFPSAGAGARVGRLGRAGPPAGAWRSAAAEPTCPTRSPARAQLRVPPPPPGRGRCARLRRGKLALHDAHCGPPAEPAHGRQQADQPPLPPPASGVLGWLAHPASHASVSEEWRRAQGSPAILMGPSYRLEPLGSPAVPRRPQTSSSNGGQKNQQDFLVSSNEGHCAGHRNGSPTGRCPFPETVFNDPLCHSCSSSPNISG